MLKVHNVLYQAAHPTVKADEECSRHTKAPETEPAVVADEADVALVALVALVAELAKLTD